MLGQQLRPLAQIMVPPPPSGFVATVSFPPDVEASLRMQAEAAGMTFEDYISQKFSATIENRNDQVILLKGNTSFCVHANSPELHNEEHLLQLMI